MAALEIFFLIFFWLWVLTAVLFLRNTILEPMPIRILPESIGLAAETVRFQATDGFELEGWKIQNVRKAPWIILCHGLGSNRANLLDIAASLVRSQFSVFLFDFRAHGGSSGHATSFGWQEQRDLEGALAFLGAQPDIAPAPYGIYGISMGGSVALMTAAFDERLKAIAADSPYLNLESSLGRHMRLMYPVLPKFPFLWFMTRTYRLRFGIWPDFLSPEDAAGKLQSRALLVIGGEADVRTPKEDIERIYQKATGDKEVWIIPNAGHLEGYSINPQAYSQRLVKFFSTHL